MPSSLHIKRPVSTIAESCSISSKRSFSSSVISPAVPAAIGTFHHDFSTIPIHAPLDEAPASGQNGNDNASGRLTLDELWKAAVATPIGRELLSRAPKQPKLKWGSTAKGFHGEWDGKVITLNKAEQNQLSDDEWKQVITLELGNAGNDTTFQAIFAQSELNPPSREDFIDTIEKVEFETRLSVIAAYNAGQFCNPGEEGCNAVFDTSVTDFNAYRKDREG
jgi:hypothetical protein